MLECPDCGRGFELDCAHYVKYLILGDIYCPQCSTRCQVAFRHRQKIQPLPVLRAFVLSGLFVCFAYLAVHMLLVFITPGLLFGISACLEFMITTCIGAVILGAIIFWAGRQILSSILGSRDCELVLRSTNGSEKCCPICRCPATPDAVVFGDSRVCPECKGEYVQRLKEGIAG